MNEEQQRIAIAEACGHEFKTHEGKSYCFFEKLDGWIYWENIIPYYTNCLDSMHEAEKALSDSVFFDYITQLHKVVGGDYPETATAAQRAEAYLKTIGKWKE